MDFRHFWRWKSGTEGGRPSMNLEVIILIKKMANENHFGGVPRIHSELLKLGYKICESQFRDICLSKEKEVMTRTGKHF